MTSTTQPHPSPPPYPLYPPEWCSEFGEDRYGIYAVLTIDDVDFHWRWIPPGSFVMGSPESEEGRYDREGPQHRVTISRGYWLAATPTTQEQWLLVSRDNPSKDFSNPNLPVENVSWSEADRYIKRLNERVAGLYIRLPNEAQWEYACRAGASTAFNNGTDCTQPTGVDPGLDEVGWYAENSNGKTHIVGDKRANSWGLYDMHGNVYEWCADGMMTYTENHAIDPVGPTGSDKISKRAIRGGGAWSRARYCRSAYRNAIERGNRIDSLGFRLAAG